MGFFNDGLGAVKIGEKWGYIDRSGNIVIEPRFELADDFHKGFGSAGQNGKVGIIDKTGAYLIKPIFDRIWFSTPEGCRKVKIGKKYDIIKV